MSERLNFDDLSAIEIPVSIAGKQYLLREADEETAAMVANARIKGARIENGQMVELPSDLGGVQSLLVSRCLWECNGQGVPVKRIERGVVKGWPSRVVKPLFEKAKEISELEEEETLEGLIKQRVDLDKRIGELQKKNESVKNESQGTETISSSVPDSAEPTVS